MLPVISSVAAATVSRFCDETAASRSVTSALSRVWLAAAETE
jgi:hypothetical protein